MVAEVVQADLIGLAHLPHSSATGARATGPPGGQPVNGWCRVGSVQAQVPAPAFTDDNAVEAAVVEGLTEAPVEIAVDSDGGAC